MALTEEQKKQRAETRKAKEKAELLEAASRGSRPGMESYRKQIKGNESISKQFDIELSPIEHLSPGALEPNQRNPYPTLEPEELEELADDIRKKGVMVPLIARPDGILVCGHNRLKAARRAGLETVPVQTLSRPFPLPPELELEIMKSENDRRRGGNWSKEKKKEFIQKHFSEELEKDRRGGDRKSKEAKQKIKIPNEDFDSGKTLSTRIEEASKGKIGQKTAERIVADLRKEAKKKKSEPTKSTKIKKEPGDPLFQEWRKLKTKLENEMGEGRESRKRLLEDMKRTISDLLKEIKR